LSGATLSTSEAVQLLQRITGLDFHLPALPGSLVTAGAGLAEFGLRLLGRRPRFCREMIRVMSFGHAYDGSRATRDLGLEYSPIETTLRRTLEWFVQQGLVRRELPGL
jgi:dihydroflavonol-4-reductase